MKENTENAINDRGILYIGTDERYLEEALFSAEVTKSIMDIPISVVAHRNVSSPFIDHVVVDSSPTQSFADKPRNLLSSPYDHTLYLDTDVYLLDDVSELFNILRAFDIAAAVDPNEWELKVEPSKYRSSVPESVPVYQTGVLVYNQSKRTKALINEWQDIQAEPAVSRDQTSFRVAVFNSDVRATALSQTYNCLIGWPQQVVGDVKAIHDTTGQIKTQEDICAIGARINDSRNPRLLYNPGDELHLPLHGYADTILGGAHRIGRKIRDQLQYYMN